MHVFRCDQGEVRSFSRTPQGGLRVEAALAKTGTLRYRDADGNTWVEYRPPESTFATDALASLRGAPVTVGHPPALVTAETFREHARGHIADDVRRDGEYVVATVVVNDAEAVRAIESGELRDVSIGYVAQVEKRAGVAPGGEHYDAVQTAYQGNHAALLPLGEGRAGKDVGLRLDGAAVQVVSTAAVPAAHQEETMSKTLRVGGKVYRADDDGEMAAAQGAIDETQKKADDGSAALGDLQKALTDALGKIAVLMAEKAAAAATAAPAEPSEEVLDAQLAAREALRADARRVLGDGTDLTGKSARQIHEAVVAKVAPTIKLDAFSAEHVEGWFRGIVAATAERNDALAAANAAAASPRADASDEDPSEVMRKASAERWKQPLSISAAKRS